MRCRVDDVDRIGRRRQHHHRAILHGARRNFRLRHLQHPAISATGEMRIDAHATGICITRRRWQRGTVFPQQCVALPEHDLVTLDRVTLVAKIVCDVVADAIEPQMGAISRSISLFSWSRQRRYPAPRLCAERRAEALAGGERVDRSVLLCKASRLACHAGIARRAR